MGVLRMLLLALLLVGAGVVSIVAARWQGAPVWLADALAVFITTQVLWFAGRDVAKRFMRFSGSYATWTLGGMGLAGFFSLLLWLLQSWPRSTSAGG